ncbi:MAG TPA: hypothetical protein PLW81_05355, partial [Thiobacillaceae bacterium]|nr:hypothetical protein [Thiobacillaceae bacterium]
MSGYAMLFLSLMPKGVERASVGQVEIGPASSLGDARYWVSCLTELPLVFRLPMGNAHATSF